MTQYPPPSYSAPPPRRRSDTGRTVAIVLTLLIVIGSVIGVYFAVHQAMQNYRVQQEAGRIQQLYARAANLYSTGRCNEAVPLFRKVRKDPNASVEIIQKAADGEAFCYRLEGQRAQEARDFFAAERWFQMAVEVAPTDLGAQEELRAVQRAMAILRGEVKPTGNPAAPPSSPATTAPGNPPAASPNPPPVDENTQKARDAVDNLNRGNVLIQQGRVGDACREWHEAMLRAPGSPAALQAQQQRRQYCQGFPYFGG
ncbi:MAG: hypothetical protein OHK0029_17310 [Armatimonadaceae bacterium]